MYVVEHTFFVAAAATKKVDFSLFLPGFSLDSNGNIAYSSAHTNALETNPINI